MRKIELLILGLLVSVSSVLFAGDVPCQDTGGMGHLISLHFPYGDMISGAIVYKDEETPMTGVFDAPIAMSCLTYECTLEQDGYEFLFAEGDFNISYINIGTRVQFEINMHFSPSLSEGSHFLRFSLKDDYGNLIIGGITSIFVLE